MPADPRWQRVQDLFDTASAWPAVERAARLEPLEADAALRAEVLALLAASDAESRASLPADPHRPAPLPEWIGPFRVLAVAGAGGRGIVYRAVRDASGVVQTVAVKVMREHLLSPEDLARFEREQRALVSLDHPGIARLVESGWDANGRPYFAMEWIEGQPIDEYCVALGLPDRLRLMIEVLDALHAAHRALIVHLDLKPSNVLVDSTGRVRILDFGTAKLLAGNETLSTEQLTPLYASPERLRAEPATTACDIYSAGLLLNRILAGRLPFGDSTSIAALGERATGAALPEVSTGDADLDAILGRALEFRPADRYASIAEFASDLRAPSDCPLPSWPLRRAQPRAGGGLRSGAAGRYCFRQLRRLATAAGQSGSRARQRSRVFPPLDDHQLRRARQRRPQHDRRRDGAPRLEPPRRRPSHACRCRRQHPGRLRPSHSRVRPRGPRGAHGPRRARQSECQRRHRGRPPQPRHPRRSPHPPPRSPAWSRRSKPPLLPNLSSAPDFC
jgi:serine/threonine protein kinase